MKIVEGAKYKINQNISLGNKRIDVGEIVTLVRYHENSEMTLVSAGDEQFSIGTDYLEPIDPLKPAHYDTGIDTIAFMRANCPPEQVEGFLRGNAIKYLQRYASKGTPIEDLKKSRHYIEMLIEELEGRE